MSTLPSEGDGLAPTITDAIVLAESTGAVEHRDLSLSGPTDLDGITINRTKTGLSPFAKILKTATHSENSGNLTGYAVEIEDPSAASGYRHVGNVSANYLLLPNAEVRALALEIATQSGLPFRESRIYWDGTRFLHVIDFEEREPVSNGDDVGLGLVTRSSYDKSWRYDCALMGKRFVCDNGMLSGEFFARVSFKHLKGAEATPWNELVTQGLSVLDAAPENLYGFAERLRALRRIPMTDEVLRQVWPLFPFIGDGIMGQVITRYLASSFHLYDRHAERAERMVRGYRGVTCYDFGIGPPELTVPLDDFDGVLGAWFAAEGELRAAPASVPSPIGDPFLDAALGVVRVRLGVRREGWAGVQLADQLSTLPTCDLAAAAWEHYARADPGLAALAPTGPVADFLSDYLSPTKTVASSGELIAKIKLLHADKDAAYGTSWKRRGEVASVLCNVARKVDRAERIVNDGSTLAGETALDTAADLFVYLVKYQLLLRDMPGQPPASEDLTAFDALADLYTDPGDSARTAEEVVANLADNLNRALALAERGAPLDERAANVEVMTRDARDLMDLIATADPALIRSLG